MSYIKTVLIILTMAGLFPDRPCIHLSQSSLWSLFTQFPSFIPAPGNQSPFCHHDFSFSRFHINWMRKYVVFCVWILPFRIMFYNHVVICSNNSFLNNILLYGYIVICLSIHLIMDNWFVSTLGVFTQDWFEHLSISLWWTDVFIFHW